MFEIIDSSMEWEGKLLHIKTGELARQAAGVACVSYGGTVVLAAVTVQKDADAPKDPSDGIALITNFISKYYAIGKIPTGFFKREGKLTEREILASRVIDRAVRPLIANTLLNEVNVVCKFLARNDKSVIPEIPALIAASVALGMSGIPFAGPVVGVNIVSDRNGKKRYNEVRDVQDSMELFAACTEDSILMVESEANEISENGMLSSLEDALESARPVIGMINEFLARCTKKSIGVLYSNPELEKKIRGMCSGPLAAVYEQSITDKEKRNTLLNDVYVKAQSELESEYNTYAIRFYIKKLEKELVKERILAQGLRIDGRSATEIRPISISLDYLPGTHGSALFTRGGTQSLVVTTLGSYQDEQIVDDLDGERREAFFLHYNFLPYAVGEVGALRAPGRREIGHGRLALKALKALLPSKDVFPYTVRVVSEITESDGSSSMATVCGSSLALMDTGVPIQKHIGGIAMGLIKSDDQFVVLSDISGDEDALGDMDFKVAGTESGITALQMDMKIQGVSIEIIKIALEQALDGRLHIIERMNGIIAEPRSTVKDTAPKILCYEIHKDMVHKVIGSGGKTIKSISTETSAKIDIDSNNFVHIMADTKETLMQAKEKIDAISGSAGAVNPVKMGEVYDGTVVGIVDFGMFVALPNKQEGLVHISEISRERIDDIRGKYNEGDLVAVRVKGIGADGKIKLTMRLDEDRSSPSPMNKRPRSQSAPNKFGNAKNQKRGSYGGGYGGKPNFDGGPDDRNSDRSDRGSGSGNRKRFF